MRTPEQAPDPDDEGDTTVKLVKLFSRPAPARRLATRGELRAELAILADYATAPATVAELPDVLENVRAEAVHQARLTGPVAPDDVVRVAIQAFDEAHYWARVLRMAWEMAPGPDVADALHGAMVRFERTADALAESARIVMSPPAGEPCAAARACVFCGAENWGCGRYCSEDCRIADQCDCPVEDDPGCPHR